MVEGVRSAEGTSIRVGDERGDPSDCPKGQRIRRVLGLLVVGGLLLVLSTLFIPHGHNLCKRSSDETIRMKDTGGKPVRTLAEIDSTWIVP